ncbi:hypothetical protein ACTVCO_10610 [Sanguibacter sp. A247]|uniref:hypothetical protein n=1 Tax=unclassified Sanguibacter TaxID=2645534 RepID=UPI003FD796CD
MRNSGMVGRLVSPSGAEFGLVPVPDPRRLSAGPDGMLLVDIEVLTSHKLVCYLGRKVPSRAVARLADAYLLASQTFEAGSPVPSVEIPEAGVTITLTVTPEGTVVLESAVVTVLGDGVPETDRLVCEVTRPSLVSTAGQLRAFLDSLTVPTSAGERPAR